MSTVSSTLPGFWVVWNPTRRSVGDRHYSQDSAVREAERLAGAHPGETFVVLRSVCARRCGKMELVDLTSSEAGEIQA